ncbi:MAG: DUF3794 domain-containing protein [Clostridia bacterium]|nr:DUF3794 domain-containing protein [Clostridia bacterium]
MDISAIDKREGQLSVCAFEQTQTAEVMGELTMPDYYPEIKKVVAVTAEPLPDTKYLSEAGLEIGGTVAFSLLYLGDDGALTCVPYVTEYSHSFPIDRDFRGSGSDISAVSVKESVSCRPLAPRTVSMKARIKSTVTADKRVGCALNCLAEDGSQASVEARHSIERLETEIGTLQRYCFSATGSISGEEKLSYKVKPVWCRASVLPKSASAGNETVTAAGDILVTCLVQTESGDYRTITKKLPFEEQISAPGAESGCECGFFGRVASVSVAYGDEGDLSIDCEYDLDAVCAKRESAVIVEDVYSTEYAVSEKRESLPSRELWSLDNKSFPVVLDSRRAGLGAEGDRIIASFGEGRMDRCDVIDGKAVLSGDISLKVLVLREGEVICEDVTAPVKAEVLAEGAEGSPIWQCDLAIGAIECSLEESAIRARAEVYLYAYAAGEKKCAPVTGLTVGRKERDTLDSTCIRIIYPEKGKRVWDIAKEMKLSIGECERKNKISRRDSSDGSPVIVR